MYSVNRCIPWQEQQHCKWRCRCCREQYCDSHKCYCIYCELTVCIGYCTNNWLWWELWKKPILCSEPLLFRSRIESIVHWHSTYNITTQWYRRTIWICSRNENIEWYWLQFTPTLKNKTDHTQNFENRRERGNQCFVLLLAANLWLTAIKEGGV